MSRYKGFLISIEGIDGAGKTTHAEMLKKFFAGQGMDAIILKEPTQSAYGKEIVVLASSHDLTPDKELRLFIEDRKLDVADRIKPALEAGKTVIMDRYYYSNMAYQGARGLDMEKIRVENEAFAPVPDLLLILDIDPKAGMERVKKRKNIVDHFENEAYLEKVRNKFLQMGKLPNAMIIDAGRPVGEVQKDIEKVVEERLLRAHDRSAHP
jgi:dTMP kinase